MFRLAWRKYYSEEYTILYNKVKKIADSAGEEITSAVRKKLKAAAKIAAKNRYKKEVNNG